MEASTISGEPYLRSRRFQSSFNPLDGSPALDDLMLRACSEDFGPSHLTNKLICSESDSLSSLVTH